MVEEECKSGVVEDNKHGGEIMNSLTRFTDVLNNVNEINFNEYLFMPKNTEWCLNTLCSLIDWDELEDDEISDDEETPQFAIDNNLIYVANIATVQDIINNAKSQKLQCLESDLFEAFMYYYRNDAFISFN